MNLVQLHQANPYLNDVYGVTLGAIFPENEKYSFQQNTRHGSELI